MVQKHGGYRRLMKTSEERTKELEKTLKRLYKDYKKLDKAYAKYANEDFRFYYEPKLKYVEKVLGED